MAGDATTARDALRRRVDRSNLLNMAGPSSSQTETLPVCQEACRP